MIRRKLGKSKLVLIDFVKTIQRGTTNLIHIIDKNSILIQFRMIKKPGQFKSLSFVLGPLE